MVKGSVRNKLLDDSNNFVFSALRGIQAGREYYVAMCPLRLVPKIFVFNESEIPPTLRAQRTLNKARIPEMASYLINNKDDYVFSSLTASIDGDIEFHPMGNNGHHLKMGQLLIPMTSKILINDGQHRRAAIQDAIEQRPDLGMESISVVFYLDRGLRNSQQMFSDLNKHAVRPTKSLNILYNNRDHFSQSLLSILGQVPIFNGLTDLEKTSISNRSNVVFTLNGFYHATTALLGKRQMNPKMTLDDERLVSDFWNQIFLNVSEWQDIVNGKLSPCDARKNYVHVHGILLQAFGRMGNAVINKCAKTWRSKLKKLKTINWQRSNTKVWEGRAMIGGTMTKVNTNILLTSNYLKTHIGLKLSDAELACEKKSMRRK